MSGTQRTQRRVAALEDLKNPIYLRVGSGPAGEKGEKGETGAKGEKGETGATGAEGRWASLHYTWSTNTEATDPGAGKVKRNAGSTALYISEKDKDTNAVAALLATWDDSTTTGNRGTITIRQVGAPTRYIVFQVTAALTDNGEWDTFTVTKTAEGAAPENEKEVTIEFSRSGDKGEKGEKGETGAKGEKGETGAKGEKGETGAKGEAGRAAGYAYTLSTNTEESDPGSGTLKANNAFALITKLFISETDADTNKLAAEIATWDDSTSSVRGQLHIRKASTPSVFAALKITGAITDKGTWDVIPVEFITSSETGFSNGDLLLVEFVPTGDKGDKGETGAAGEKGAEGAPGVASTADWKDSCRAATTANITISTALNNLDVLDGVTLATGDRVLVKNQTTTKENGIWVVGVTPARATDADAAGELSGGSTVYVEEGTVNKRRDFTIITAGSITPGTTSHEWAQLQGRDFGLVEALPTTEAVKGDRCTYIADKTNGIIWHLVYTNEDEEHPWNKIGGPPLRSQYTAAENLSTTKTTPQSTNAPSVTVPLTMEFDVDFGANLIVGTETFQARMRLFINGVEQTDKASWTSAYGIGPLLGKDKKTAAESQAVQARYYSATEGKTSNFYAPYIEIDPIRVG